MTTLPQSPPPAQKTLANRKKRKKSPIGEQIGAVLNPAFDCRTVAFEVLGGEVADQVLRAATHVRWSEVAPDTGPVVFSVLAQHGENDPSVRRFVAHVFLALERMSLTKRRACCSALFRGHTHEISAEGNRVYVPAKRAGGLSARLGCSPRTLDRHCAVMQAAGICDVWQPPVGVCTREMMGREHAYAIYRWVGELPRTVADLLYGWYGNKFRRKQAAGLMKLVEKAPASSPAPAGAPAPIRTTARSAELAGDFLRFVPRPP